MSNAGLGPKQMLEECTFMAMRLHMDNFHDMEDAAADGVLAMLEAEAKAEEGKPLAHYERRSAFGAVHNFYSANKRRREHEFLSLTKRVDDGEGDVDYLDQYSEPVGESWQERRDATEDALFLRGLVDSLPEKDAEVIRRRFFQDETLETIGNAMGISKERARQIEEKALRLLGHRYNHAS